MIILYTIMSTCDMIILYIMLSTCDMIILFTRDLCRKKSKLILLSNFRHILLEISLTLTSPHSWKRFREVVFLRIHKRDSCLIIFGFILASSFLKITLTFFSISLLLFLALVALVLQLVVEVLPDNCAQEG